MVGKSSIGIFVLNSNAVARSKEKYVILRTRMAEMYKDVMENNAVASFRTAMLVFHNDYFGIKNGHKVCSDCYYRYD